MRFSVFYDEHKDVEAHIKPLFRALELRRAEGRLECSQKYIYYPLSLPLSPSLSKKELLIIFKKTGRPRYHRVY